MSSKTISHYKIIEKIGQGGLGTVYLAEDTILNRRVALKFLSETQADAHQQILAEARSAALIDHPYSCKVFETGQAGGKSFIVMEYVEGETLAERFKAGRIPLDETLRIAGEMTEALADAHERAIVHCDLKPANVMLARNGHVKLMDFGLARIVRRAKNNEDITEKLSETKEPVTGTPAYMPPEQARGGYLDARTDVFAFGILFFEMLTGIHPFRRTSSQATMAAVLSEEPPRIDQIDPSISPSIIEIVYRALRKDPAARYPSARELLSDLVQAQKDERLNTASGAAPLESDTETIEPISPAIAILPFTDFSPEQNQEHLCQGLADELITALGGVEDLKVASRTASFRYKNADAKLQEIARELQVTFILEGSIQKVGDRLRISVKLVDVNTGYPAWSEKYEGKMDDIFEIQDKISHSVVDKLRDTLNLAGEAKAALDEPRNVRAYECYLKGRFFWNKRSAENLRLSIDQFERALEEEPDYALAHAGLADAYVTLSLYGVVSPLEAIPSARYAADCALEIKPKLAEALTAHACVRAIFDWDWKSAAQEFETAIRLNPRYAQARQWYAMNCLAPTGEFDRARDELNQAAALEPVSLAIKTSLGVLYFFRRNYDEAANQFRAALEMDDGFYLARFFLGQTYAAQARYDESLRELERAAEANPMSQETISAAGYTWALSGNPSEAQRALETLSRHSEERYISPVLIAQVQTGLNDHESALTSLEEAYRNRSTDLIWIKVLPAFDRIRSHGRFTELLKKMRLMMKTPRAKSPDQPSGGYI